MRAQNLTLKQLNELLIDEGLVAEFICKIVNSRNESYAAMYNVYLIDDESFPDDESRYVNIYVSYNPNGTLKASL